VAAGGGPFALGAVADATSTHTAFVAVPLLVAAASVALVTALATGRPRRRLPRSPEQDSGWPGTAS